MSSPHALLVVAPTAWTPDVDAAVRSSAGVSRFDSEAAAIDAIERATPFCAIVAQEILADGLGWRVVRRARLRLRTCPAVVLTERVTRGPEEIDASVLGAHVWRAPLTVAQALPFVARALIHADEPILFLSAVKEAAIVGRLSTRERQVLQATLDGQSQRKTAETLDLELSTIKSHARSVMAKLVLERLSDLRVHAASLRR